MGCQRVSGTQHWSVSTYQIGIIHDLYRRRTAIVTHRRQCGSQLDRLWLVRVCCSVDKLVNMTVTTQNLCCQYSPVYTLEGEAIHCSIQISLLHRRRQRMSETPFRHSDTTHVEMSPVSTRNCASKDYVPVIFVLNG